MKIPKGISVEPPISYREIVHVLRIETDSLVICEHKIIRERMGIRGLFRTKAKGIHANEFGTIDYWEL